MYLQHEAVVVVQSSENLADAFPVMYEQRIVQMEQISQYNNYCALPANY